MKIKLVLQSTKPFQGEDFHQGMVGGTQAAVVSLAEGFFKLGHEVEVVSLSKDAYVCRGVKYVSFESISSGACDLAILFKKWCSVVDNICATRKIFWLTDVIPDLKNIGHAVEWCDTIFYMSSYQQGKLNESLRAFNAGGKCVVIEDLPICVDDYNECTQDRSNNLIYCSMPDRGLRHLVAIFPKILAAVPDARLIITSDFTLWGIGSDIARFKDTFATIPNIEYYGAVSRPNLINLQKSAKIMAYPCEFPEGFCVAAAECMAAGVVPVTTRNFALSTTVSTLGDFAGTNVESCLYQHRFVKLCIGLLTRESHWKDRSRACHEKALERFSPERIAGNVLKHVDLGALEP